MSPRSAVLEVTYAADPPELTSPEMLETSTIAPFPCSSNDGRAARASRSGPVTFPCDRMCLCPPGLRRCRIVCLIGWGQRRQATEGSDGEHGTARARGSPRARGALPPLRRDAEFRAEQPLYDGSAPRDPPGVQ